MIHRKCREREAALRQTHEERLLARNEAYWSARTEAVALEKERDALKEALAASESRNADLLARFYDLRREGFNAPAPHGVAVPAVEIPSNVMEAIRSVARETEPLFMELCQDAEREIALGGDLSALCKTIRAGSSYNPFAVS